MSSSIPRCPCRRRLGAAFVALSGLASAQTLTVTTSADVSDVGSGATLPDLPGPDGVVSFREALLVADNMPGHQTVGFAIPVEDWYLADIYPGLCLLQGSFAWGAGDSVTVDGTTQTAFTGDTNPDGNELVVYGLSLYIGGPNSVVTGLHDSRVEVRGYASEIHGNTGGMHIVVYTTAYNLVHDNEAWTIKIDQAHRNVVARNTTARVLVWGGGSFGPAIDNRVGGPDPADRNYITGWGNYGEHGTPGGTSMEVAFTQGTLIENNYIGTTPDGMEIGSRASTVGVGIVNDNVDLTVRNNLIATQARGVGPVEGVLYGQAIYLQSYDGGSGIHILGNTLGLNAAGEPLLGGVNGILVSRYAVEQAVDVHIGGPNPGEGNVIAGHASTGVLMMNGPGIVPVGAIRLSGNAIFAGGEIGIDLTPNTWTFGPTPNDPLDADDGANGLQNYPEVLSATHAGSSIRLRGVLHSEPLGQFTLEFFASRDCHPSGFGEAEVYLGSTSVSTNAAGDASFDTNVPALAPPGWVVTSTATLEPIGATSEFSACTPIEGMGTRDARPVLPPRRF